MTFGSGIAESPLRFPTEWSGPSLVHSKTPDRREMDQASADQLSHASAIITGSWLATATGSQEL